MGKNKRYSGYKSFSFLQPGKDYSPFKLAKEIGRVQSSTVSLSTSEEERVQTIIEKNPTISLHDHTFVWPEDSSQFIDYVRSGRWSLGYEGLAYSGLDAVFEGLLDGIAVIRSRDPWDWENVVHQIGMVREDLDHQNMVFVATGTEDIVKAHRDGGIAMVLHLEAPPRLGEDLTRLEVLYGLGVRCMGIAYSRGNEFGSGLADKVDRGLTDLGYDYVQALNRLGIAVDLSHAGDRTGLEAIEASKEPVFITHAGARALWSSRRMKPDELIERLAEKDGVFGIEAAPHSTLTKHNLRHNLEGVMEHFEYVEKLVGIDQAALGPDTLFGDHVALHKIFRDFLSISAAAEEGLPAFPRVEYVDGLENPSEFSNCVRWMVKHGYSDQEIAKATGGNILRVARTVWADS
ncbi:MAG: membrane dipeptidase [Candidatus Aenigmarchaeota archaeon]|nr:membrane dipeptidase [Candidatus Aenigmarchaeota archaeon]